MRHTPVRVPQPPPAPARWGGRPRAAPSAGSGSRHRGLPVRPGTRQAEQTAPEPPDSSSAVPLREAGPRTALPTRHHRHPHCIGLALRSGGCPVPGRTWRLQPWGSTTHARTPGPRAVDGGIHRSSQHRPRHRPTGHRDSSALHEAQPPLAGAPGLRASAARPGGSRGPCPWRGSAPQRGGGVGEAGPSLWRSCTERSRRGGGRASSAWGGGHRELAAALCQQGRAGGRGHA